MENLEQWQAKYPILEQIADSVERGVQGGRDLVKAVLPAATASVTDKVVDAATEPGMGLARTGRALAYGDRLTTGKGQTLHLKDDTVDAITLAIPMARAAGKVGGAVAMAPSPRAGSIAAQKGYIRGTMANTLTAEDSAALSKAAKIPDTQSQYAQTKWWKGGEPGERGWRNEVSDDKAVNLLSQNYQIDPSRRMVIPMQKAYGHPQLYADYPQLKNANLILDPSLDKYPDVPAYFDSHTGNIHMSPTYAKNDPTGALSLMVHEVDHAVQKIEGFQGGADYIALTDKYGPAKGERMYLDAAGEASARSQQARRAMTQEERGKTFPMSKAYTGSDYRKLKWNHKDPGE